MLKASMRLGSPLSPTFVLKISPNYYSTISLMIGRIQYILLSLTHTRRQKHMALTHKQDKRQLSKQITISGICQHSFLCFLTRNKILQVIGLGDSPLRGGPYWFWSHGRLLYCYHTFENRSLGNHGFIQITAATGE